ncbi:MAG: transposon-encoded TnpW family protein [Dehalococcoidia bacterium]|jgi:hypothetical protein|nr:transposon-encoded TnpW family protein [Dehalococcoidia bacterium]
MDSKRVKAQPKGFMRKRIGSTVYDVNLCFSHEAKELLQDKLLRLAINDLNMNLTDVRMDIPQTNRLPERSICS